MARSLRSLRQVATLRHGHMALGVCEHIWPFSLRDVWATLLSPKWAEIFVAQMAGDETSLPHLLALRGTIVLLNKKQDENVSKWRPVQGSKSTKSHKYAQSGFK